MASPVAVLAGERVAGLGSHPLPKHGDLHASHSHSVDDILKESLEHELRGLDEYRTLLALVRDRSIILEEYARDQIAAEEDHVNEIRRMMRR